MATDYGTDLHCTDDIDPAFTELTGRTLLVQALYRRLTTPRGWLFYAPEYGLDVRSYLNESLTPADIFDLQVAAARECQADERVLACTARATYDAAARSLTLTLSVQDAEGPFAMVLAIDKVTVALLSAQ